MTWSEPKSLIILLVNKHQMSTFWDPSPAPGSVEASDNQMRFPG